MRPSTWIFCLALFAQGAVATGFPGEGDFAAGGLIGTVGAVNGKYMITKEAGVDAGVEILDHPLTVFYGDILWHFERLFGKSSRFGRESSLYVGGGGGVGFWNRLQTCGRWNCSWPNNSSGSGNGMFIRTVAGVEWYPPKTHWSVFGEIAPSFMIYPNGSFIDVAVGGRYWF
jgi:hypothetical protein